MVTVLICWLRKQEQSRVKQELRKTSHNRLELIRTELEPTSTKGNVTQT